MTQTNGARQQPEQDLQTLLELGSNAAQLLKAPVYNVAYRSTLEKLMQDWLMTDPKEERKRESLYYQARGLMGAMKELAQMVNRAEEALTKQNEQQSPEARHRDYLDNQGFAPSYN